MSNVDPLLHLDVNGRSIDLVLPAFSAVHPSIQEPRVRNAATLARVLPLMLLDHVVAVDDTPLDLRRADELATDAPLVQAIMSRVKQLFEERRKAGVILLLCPGCFNSEIEVTVDAYALALAAPIPSLFDGPFLEVPWLADALGYGVRPAGLQRAASVRVAVPSSCAGRPGQVTGGTLVHIEDEPGDHIKPPDEYDEDFDFSHCGPGYRALLRLVRALEPRHPVEVLEQMPAVDFFFLDLAYYLTHLARIRADTPGRVRCNRCATEFLPVV